MKSLIVLAAFAFAVNASAAPVFCGNATEGYSVTLNSDHRSAVVEKDGQPVEFGELNCAFPDSMLPNGPFVVCHSPHVADAGFGATFRYVQKSLIIRAKLSKMTFAGAHQVADLACVAALDDARETVKAINVNGVKARTLISALKDVGAVAQSHIEMSTLNVSEVKMEYTPRRFIYAQGTLVDNNNSGKQLNPITHNAHELYAALKDAGVPSLELEGFIGTSIVRAKNIQCSSGYNIGSHSVFSSCTITLQ